MAEFNGGIKCHYQYILTAIHELIEALEALNTITKIFYEDFENESNNFKHFYEKLKDFVETQILPTADAESEFQDILLRLLPEKAELPYDYVKRCTLHRESYVIYRENRYR